MLGIGLFCFLLFVGMMLIFFVPQLQEGPGPLALAAPQPPATATPDFVLPATWTPSPEPEIIPTSLPTNIAFGLLPTPIYTPRPTSLPGIPFPSFAPFQQPATISVIDLARIMQGESPGDKEAAYMVGWVAKNRLQHIGYGDTYAVVSSGFFGYLDGVEPTDEFKNIARRVIRDRIDPTDGCLYALSRTDITNLGVPPGRADVAYGEWFFFKTWPLTGR